MRNVTNAGYGKFFTICHLPYEPVRVYHLVRYAQNYLSYNEMHLNQGTTLKMIFQSYQRDPLQKLWRSWGWCKGIFQWCSMIGLNFPILWILVLLRNQIASPFAITVEFLLALISLMLKFLARVTLNFAHILRVRFTFGGIGSFKITCLLI